MINIFPHISTADERDEMDIELLGGDEKHWQTNVFAPSPEDERPHYGVFNSVEDVSSVAEFHSYKIDWNEDRIIWSVDGSVVRTLTPGRSSMTQGFAV